MYDELISKQRLFFESGKTLSLEFRREALDKLYKAIQSNMKDLGDAIKTDLGKSTFEAGMCEIRLTLSEITYMKKHLRKFAKPKRVPTPLSHFYSTSKVYASPYGVVLIMSPWNYPLLLSLEPLVDAIAAGNTAIIKPSLYATFTSNAIEKLIKGTFNEEYVSVVTGGREENKNLLLSKFDYIFFTGSKNVGKEVMRRAAEHLTPVTLELGGKSPCVVLKNANIKAAARRIVFGKYLNCGQTCVAPDYVLVDESVKNELIDALKKEVKTQFGEKPLENQDYGKIINKKHFDRLSGLIDKEKVIYGGNTSESTLQIEPTIINNVTLDDAIMKEEIFGPLLPIISVKDEDEAIRIIKSLEHPLALYVFTSSKKDEKRFINTVGFGGGCVNDTIVHLATSNMGFGGFGESGMGSYHGKKGFDTFSHYKSILKKTTLFDLPIRYQPYSSKKEKLIKMFLR